MGYNKTIWEDRIIDPVTQEVIQAGTKFTAARANKFEQGVADAHLLVEGLAQQVVGSSVVSGLQFTTSGLTANYTAGTAYVNGVRFEVAAGSIALNPTQGQYIYLDSDGVVKKTTSQATAQAKCLLWYLATDASNVITSTDSRKTPGVQDASITQKGIVQLNDTVTSVSTTQAATAKAAKTAYDKAASAETAANNAIPATQKGVANGVATLGTDGKVTPSQLGGNVLDNGRYQAEFGFDGATLNEVWLSNDTVTIKDVVSGIFTAPAYGISGSPTSKTGIIIKPKYVITSLKVTKSSTDATNVYLVDDSDGSTVANGVFDGTGSYTFTGVSLQPSKSYRVVCDKGGSAYSGHSKSGVTFPIVTEAFDVTSGYNINANTSTLYSITIVDASQVSTDILTGTVTKTITPSDLKKWGNAKWEQNKPTNTNVVCDVLKDHLHLTNFLKTVNTDDTIFNTAWKANKFKASGATNSVKVKFKACKLGSPTNSLEVHIYSKGGNGNPLTSLGSALIAASSLTAAPSFVDQELTINLSTPLVYGEEYFVFFKSLGGVDASNYFLIGAQMGYTGLQEHYYTTNSGTLWQIYNDRKLAVDVTSQETLKTDIQSIADLSDLEVTQNPSLKLRWTLSRNATTDPSPTVKNPSVTWEGELYNPEGWEKITDVTLAVDATKVDFENLGLEKYRRINVYIGVRPTVDNLSLQLVLNDDTGANYGTSASGSNITVGTVYASISNTNLTSSFMSNLILEIDNVSGQRKFMSHRGALNTGVGNGSVMNAGSLWIGTALINKMSFKVPSNAIAAGSRFIVMGVK